MFSLCTSVGLVVIGCCFYTSRLALLNTQEYPNVLTLRVRMPIVPDMMYPRNFITKIIKYDKVVDIPNSMTVLPELLPYSIEMVSWYLERGAFAPALPKGPGCATLHKS